MVLLALVLLARPGRAAEIVDLPSAAGGTQRVWYDAPANPWAVVILFMGGDGINGLTPEGDFRRGGNFLIRTRPLWLAQGLGVLIPDKPAGLSDLYGRRTSADYARDIRDLASFARARSSAPIWLIGTSLGSITAAAGAASLTRGEIAGAVLTSTVTRRGAGAQMWERVFTAELPAIYVPVLVVAHENDGCAYSSPANAPGLCAALTGAPRTEIFLVTGGSPPCSGPCEPFAAHGYFGIEAEVVGRIAGWMRGR